jgi:hypothetical protein
MKDEGKKENLSSNPPTSRMTIFKFAEHEVIISMRFGPNNGKITAPFTIALKSLVV